MRLQKSRVSAEEELVAHINAGYQLLNYLKASYYSKRRAGSFDPNKDNLLYQNSIAEWSAIVAQSLSTIFPTELEKNQFIHARAQIRGYPSGQNIEWASLVNNMEDKLQALERILRLDLLRYTDLPIGLRLNVEDIDSFRKVRDVNPALVDRFLRNGRFEEAEDSIKVAFEEILDVPFHTKDWGGESNDLYTSNIIVNGNRQTAAFLLKGRAIKSKVLQISNCGKNGDQLVRLFESPAQLFVVQFVGEVSQNIIKDVEGKVNEKRSKGEQAWYCIINGQDTARILAAYGKLR